MKNERLVSRLMGYPMDAEVKFATGQKTAVLDALSVYDGPGNVVWIDLGDYAESLAERAKCQDLSHIRPEESQATIGLVPDERS